MVQILAADELQRDLQRELAYDGLRATEAKGNKGGRRAAIPSDKADSVRAAYLEGQFMVSLVRECDVSRGAIRTVVAGLLSVHTPADPGALAPELRLSPTCRAGSRAFSVPSIWSLPSAPRSTGG
ncbi:hypothetical protein ACFV0Y_23795 [Streptomyces sp. NPDC059569]|uniref:hypothetical protein n=1 Tax=Streptomyces sp. NPDC059569 TaxID=3346869 RepID=UPI003694F659